MELSPSSALHAMGNPWAAALFETDVIHSVPVSHQEGRNSHVPGSMYPTIEDRNHLIIGSDSQRAARTKVILDIHNEKCIPACKIHRSAHAFENGGDHFPFLYPLMQISGSSFATFIDNFASCAASTTAVTSLYAPGASSATPRCEGLRMMMPCAVS